jgi:hypothetical protein
MKGPMFVNSNYHSNFERERTYKKHLQQLEAIKRKKNNSELERISMLDNIKLIKVANQRHQRAEKEDRLQKENHILLGHIVSINVKGYASETHKRVQSTQSPTKSRNNYVRKNEEERIRYENLKLAQRLIEVDQNTNKQWESQMNDHRRIGRQLKKIHENPLDRKGVLKSVDSNRRNINRLKLPPMAQDRSYNNSKLSGGQENGTSEDSYSTSKRVSHTVESYGLPVGENAIRHRFSEAYEYETN